MTPKEQCDAAEAEYAQLIATCTARPMTPAEFRGLYGEVVVEDCYRLRSLDFTPDVILDIGANVGTFSRFARELFPDARIVAVEPHPGNYAVLDYWPTPAKKPLLYNAAIGIGQLWSSNHHVNSAHASYLCTGLGYPDGALRDCPDFNRTEIRTTTLDYLFASYVCHNETVFVKVDCEGGENTIFSHPPSMRALGQVDAMAIELHYFGSDTGDLEYVRSITAAGLRGLEATHDCETIHPIFHARKKPHDHK